MNICLITFKYPPMVSGGLGNAVYRITKNLSEEGCNIHVIAPGENKIGDLIGSMWEDGIEVHRTFPSLGYYSDNPAELREIGDYIINLHEKVHFDLIHSMFILPPGLVGAMVAKEIQRPLIASIRGSDVEVMRYSPNALQFAKMGTRAGRYSYISYC